MITCAFFNSMAINIAYPENMPNTALIQIHEALGQPDEQQGRRISSIEGKAASEAYQLIGLRSADVPLWVSGFAQVGICGSDWIRERQLQYGLKFEVLGSYRYGRKFFTKPKNEFVVPDDVEVNDTVDLKPNLVVGEYPHLMHEHLERKGWAGRIVDFGEGGEHADLRVFREECVQRGVMGIMISHGGIPEMVSVGRVYGFLVSETNGTKEENGIKVIDVVHEISMQLITTQYALQAREEEISEIARRMNEVYTLKYKEKPNNPIEGRISGERVL